MIQLSIAVGLALLPIITSAQQALTIKSPTDAFAVASTAQATAKKNGPFLAISIERHTIWAPQIFKDTNHVVSYTAAIASRNSNGQWQPKRQSAPVPTKITLKPGESHQLPPTTLIIPIDGIQQLEKHWVVIEMKLRAPASSTGYAYTYAHSETLNLPPH